MRKIKVSKSRVAAAALLLLVLVVGILFPVSGSSAKYTTQVSLSGKINYQFDNTLATSLKVDGTDTYKLIPGTTVTPGAKVIVTGRTETPAYLYVTVSGMYAPKLTDDWTKLEDVTGAGNATVYVYNGAAIPKEPLIVFKPVELDKEPATHGGDAFVSAYLVEKVGEETASAAFAARAARTSTILSSATEKFELATVTAAVNDGDYTVQNTGNIDAYIRAKVVLNRVDEAGNIEADDAPLLAGVDELPVPEGWTKVGDYLYYNGTVASNGKVAPGGVTDPALDPAEVAEGVQITLIAEAIQADGGAAADAWKVTPTETSDGVVWTTP